MVERSEIARVAREIVAANPEKAKQARHRFILKGWFDASVIKVFGGKITRAQAQAAVDVALQAEDADHG